MNDDPYKDLFLKFKDGCEDAFAEIYKAYEKLIYFLVLSIVGNDEVAKDIVQEVFVTMFVKVHTTKQNSNFHFWINKLAKNLAYDYLRTTKEQKELTDNDIDRITLSKFERTFDFKLEYHLNKKDNLLLIYHLVYGLGFREMGHMLGLSYDAVIKRYYRAVHRMRAFYKEGKEEKRNVKV